MLKNKSKVSISIEGFTDKSLKVPTFLLQYWKQVTVSALALIAMLLSSIFYLAAKQKTDSISLQYEASLNKEKEKLRAINQDRMESKKDMSLAKESLNKIDSTIEIINAKMKRRGLKALPLANVGGPVETDEGGIELLGEYYENVLKELDKKLSSFPLGTPHPGPITSKFSYRANPFTNRGRELHAGVDLKGKTGDAIKVTAAGTVIFAGYEGGYGKVVKVKHANGYETRYAHLSKTIAKVGQKVDVGTTIGLLGSTGRSTGPHVHYEILKDNKKINPESHFKL